MADDIEQVAVALEESFLAPRRPSAERWSCDIRRRVVQRLVGRYDCILPSKDAAGRTARRRVLALLCATVTTLILYSVIRAQVHAGLFFKSFGSDAIQFPLSLASFFENAASLSSSFFYLSPAVQMAQVYASRGAGLDCVNSHTMIVMLLSSSLWAIWGVYSPMWPAVPSNALGVVAATCYLAFCWSYVLRGRAKSSSWGLPAVLGTIATVLVACAFFLYARSSIERAERVGFVAMFTSIALFASPLSALRRVIADRSSVLLPPVQTIVQLVNCILWVIVGARSKSVEVLVCNSLGLVLAAVQMGLIAMFPATKIALAAEDRS